MKVVGIGGGHGLSVTLRAALRYADQVSAVVTVADDGGSSGRLTRDLGIPPPGDIRNCLVALAGEGELADVFQHRFEDGELEGHPVGNVIIAGLAEMHGDFGSAVAAAGRLVGAAGKVYPATTELVRLSAKVDGGEVTGQVAVAQTRAPIRSVHLTPESPEAFPAAVSAILGADQVIVGPGSLFTSIIATLLVPGISRALGDTSAQRVFVANAREQAGETESLSLAQLVAALFDHIGQASIDTVIVQDPPLDGGVAFRPEEWPWDDVEVVPADVADPEWHDAERLAKTLASL